MEVFTEMEALHTCIERIPMIEILHLAEIEHPRPLFLTNMNDTWHIAGVQQIIIECLNKNIWDLWTYLRS